MTVGNDVLLHLTVRCFNSSLCRMSVICDLHVYVQFCGAVRDFEYWSALCVFVPPIQAYNQKQLTTFQPSKKNKVKPVPNFTENQGHRVYYYHLILRKIVENAAEARENLIPLLLIPSRCCPRFSCNNLRFILYILSTKVSQMFLL